MPDPVRGHSNAGRRWVCPVCDAVWEDDGSPDLGLGVRCCDDDCNGDGSPFGARMVLDADPLSRGSDVGQNDAGSNRAIATPYVIDYDECGDPIIAWDVCPDCGKVDAHSDDSGREGVRCG